MSRVARARIDLAALRHNYHRVSKLASDSKIISIIKANAYGHGIGRIAMALATSDAFGVACLEEAAKLRKCGIKNPILLLEGVFEETEIKFVNGLNLEIVVHSEYQIEWLEKAKVTTKMPVWLKVDTGMSRLGFNVDEAKIIWRRLFDCECVDNNIRFMTHLACSDDRSSTQTVHQLQLLYEALDGLTGEQTIANSAGILGWEETHAQWVRPGIMLYGVSPFLDSIGQNEGLKPVMTLTSTLIAIHQLKSGTPIGYGHTWTCPQDMDVGVVAIGYGDGYPRHAPIGTPVCINDVKAQLIGRVSMDMITIDLRKAPNAKIGDPVTLWGQGLPVEEVARWAGTIGYELLCGVTGRVHFDYH